MKAEELRIGNFVKADKDDYQGIVSAILSDELVEVTYPSGVTASEYPEELAPIPLTEDWLLRAGFRKQINKGFVTFHNYVCMTDFYLRESFKGGYYFGFIINGRHYEFNDATNYEYVHQLQNLYFALTGDELTFADNHNPCTSSDPDDRCENCNCWKSTRSNCS